VREKFSPGKKRANFGPQIQNLNLRARAQFSEIFCKFCARARNFVQILRPPAKSTKWSRFEKVEILTNLYIFIKINNFQKRGENVFIKVINVFAKNKKVKEEGDYFFKIIYKHKIYNYKNINGG